MNNNNLSFVALDIETATGKRSSICEIGLTIVENLQIVESKSWLIQPKDNIYWERNISIHGIRPDQTANKPLFPDVWNEILPYIENKVVVAHNTAFDMYAIADALNEYNLPFPTFEYFCTLRLSQRCFSLLKYSLAPLCSSIGIHIENHHRACSDSEACAKVMLKCLEETAVTSFEELEQKTSIKRGVFNGKSHIGQRSTLVSCHSKQKYQPTTDHTNFDPNNYFYGKTVMFTGGMRYGNRNTMRALIDNIGGISIDKFRNDIEVLVEGTLDPRFLKEDGKSEKQRKCEDKLAKGEEIEILSEDEFYERLGFWDE